MFQRRWRQCKEVSNYRDDNWNNRKRTHLKGEVHPNRFSCGTIFIFFCKRLKPKRITNIITLSPRKFSKEIPLEKCPQFFFTSRHYSIMVPKMELIISTYFPPMQTIKLEGEVKLNGHCVPFPMHSPNKHAHKVEEGSLANIRGRMVGSRWDRKNAHLWFLST